MKLKSLRLKLNKTQQQVAVELNMQRTKYARIESGESNADHETLILLANYFHTTIDNILNHEVPYLLDKSTLNEKQRELIEYARTMTEEECRLTLAYIEGTRAGIKEREIKINNLRG